MESNPDGSCVCEQFANPPGQPGPYLAGIPPGCSLTAGIPWSGRASDLTGKILPVAISVKSPGLRNEETCISWPKITFRPGESSYQTACGIAIQQDGSITQFAQWLNLTLR